MFLSSRKIHAHIPEFEKNKVPTNSTLLYITGSERKLQLAIESNKLAPLATQPPSEFSSDQAVLYFYLDETTVNHHMQWLSCLHESIKFKILVFAVPNTLLHPVTSRAKLLNESPTVVQGTIRHTGDRCIGFVGERGWDSLQSIHVSFGWAK